MESYHIISGYWLKKMDEYILGISGTNNYCHDNSVAIVKNGKVLFAASEERYSRIKHDGSLPQQALENGLNFLNLKNNIFHIVAVGYPKRNVLSLVTNRYYYEFFLLVFELLVYRNILLIKDLITFFSRKKNVTKERRKASNFFSQGKEIVYVDHHLAHAASAYYQSGFDKSICIVLDAFGSRLNGDIRSGAVFLCDKEGMTEIISVPSYASIGLFYQSVTLALGFTPGDGEGKTMGLAAYGNADTYYSILREFVPKFNKDKWQKGRDSLAVFFSSMPKFYHLFYTTKFGRTLKKMIKEGKKEDIAAAAQRILEEEIINLVKYVCKEYKGIHDICLAGGVFLNVKTNKKILELPNVNNLFIQPHAGDGGVSVGAALVASSKKYIFQNFGKALNTGGLGQSFSNQDILKELEKYKSKLNYKKQKEIVEYTANLLIKGKVIGWFQGRAEWGPRALGFRSVLADPRNIEVKDRINDVLKNREWFMPFAPSVLEEEANKFFKNCKKSPFMTIVFDIVKGKEKKIPAAIHIDNTARPNTVNKQNNALYYNLIKSFYKKTGLPVILNTSFNKHGLPIVNSPKDAIEHLLMGAVDELIIGSYSVMRKEL